MIVFVDENHVSFGLVILLEHRYKTSRIPELTKTLGACDVDQIPIVLKSLNNVLLDAALLH